MRGQATKHFWRAIACGALILGAGSASARPESAAVIAKQRLNECMSRRMSADRSLSYNDAMRACKVRLQPPKDLASLNPVGTVAKGR